MNIAQKVVTMQNMLRPAPLEKRLEGNLNRNASRKCFWDCYWETCRSAIGEFFFPVPSNIPRCLCKRWLGPVPFSRGFSHTVFL